MMLVSIMPSVSGFAEGKNEKIMFNVALSGEVPHARQNANELASALT
jgi:hypothetical protein